MNILKKPVQGRGNQLRAKKDSSNASTLKKKNSTRDRAS